MLTMIALTLALRAAPQQVVQVPVEDPRLPEGPLEFVAGWDSLRLYIDATSWERSDLQDLVRGTVVIVAPESRRTLQVARTWVDCRRQVFQVSTGRAYDASGVELEATLYLPDHPVGGSGPMKELADRVCATPFAVAPEGSAADWRHALDETRAAVTPTP